MLISSRSWRRVTCKGPGADAFLEYLTNGAIKTQLDPLYIAYICGFFCMVGHIYPIYFNFKGGKGALTACGTVLLINPYIFLILVAIFIIVSATTKLISVASMLGAISFPIATFFLIKTGDYTFSIFGMPQKVVMTLFACLFALVVIVKHKDNIKRLLKGEENKFSFKKK